MLWQNPNKGIPARLVYNFNMCGFRPGVGNSSKVIGSKSKSKSCPDITDYLSFKSNMKQFSSKTHNGRVLRRGFVQVIGEADSSTLDESQHND